MFNNYHIFPAKTKTKKGYKIVKEKKEKSSSLMYRYHNGVLVKISGMMEKLQMESIAFIV